MSVHPKLFIPLILISSFQPHKAFVHSHDLSYHTACVCAMPRNATKPSWGFCQGQQQHSVLSPKKARLLLIYPKNPCFHKASSSQSFYLRKPLHLEKPLSTLHRKIVKRCPEYISSVVEVSSCSY